MPKVFNPTTSAPGAYLKQRNKMLSLLPPKAAFRAGYSDEFYPYPIIHSGKEVQDLKRIQRVLIKAIHKVVGAYFTDERISSRVPLSKKVLRELRKISTATYELGGIRPDYLYTKEGVPVICEINARFIFNAYFMSIYMSDVFRKLHPKHKPLGDLARLSQSLRRDLSEQQIAVIKGKEDGYDIHSLLLEYNNTKLFSHLEIDSVIAEYSGIILELHQSEVAEHLSKICEAMLSGKRILNDPRTLFIVHDKRLLSVLSDRKIMSTYIGEEDAEFLSSHVIATYVKGHHKKIFELAIKDKDQWVAKKAISGKANGLFIGAEKNATEWKRVLKQSDTLLQPRIVEKRFSFWDPLKREEGEWFLAGVLPIWNNEVFGPGLYRVSHTDKHDFSYFLQPVL